MRRLCSNKRGDAEVSRTTLNIPHPHPDGAAEKWIAGHLLAFFEKKAVTFAIRSPDGDLYGAIGIMLKNPDEIGELGYFLGVLSWEKAS
jgi:ribosomal-protein-alanine N-acetyltransferase